MNNPFKAPVNVLGGGYIKQISDNPYDGGTWKSIGQTHEQGGMPIDSTGDGRPDAEIETNETIHQSSITGDKYIGGNLKIPNTKLKFKDAFKLIAKEEEKTEKFANRAKNLMEEANPENKYGVLTYNSGNVMSWSALNKQKQLAGNKEELAQLQEAIHQVADVAGTEPKNIANQMRNGGKIKIPLPQMGDGGTKSGKWRYNNTNLEGEDPKILEFVKLLEQKGYSGQSGPKSGVSNRYTKSGNPSRHIKGQALDMFFDKGKDAYQAILNDPELAGYLASNGLTALNEYDPNVAKGTGATAGHIHIGYDRGTNIADAFRNDAKKLYPEWDWENYQKGIPNNIKGIPKAQLMQARKVMGDAQDEPQQVVPGAITPSFRFDQHPTQDPTPVAQAQPSFNPYDFSGQHTWQAPPKVKTSLADRNKLQPGQFLPEIMALADRPDFVPHESITPTLFQPYNVSFQDRLNQNNASFRALQENSVNNPEALSVLAAQKYAADNGVEADQFRTNQQISNEVTNKNIALINDAREKNLQLSDQQFVRQTQAKENTRANQRAAMNSIADKIGKNKYENNNIRLSENLFNFRPDQQYNMQNQNPDAYFHTPVVGNQMFNTGNPQYDPNNTVTYGVDADGQPVVKKIVDNPDRRTNKRYWAGGKVKNPFRK